jgi:C4-dicarboxylate transporter, DctM subunit
MLILASLIVLCIMLIIGVGLPFAFGAVLLLLGVFGGHDVAGFFPAGHWRLNTVVLLAIPLFILAGGFMERGKIAAPLIHLAELFVGHIRGGLSAAAVLASGIFGSISGSAAATVSCIGSIMAPHLRRANYPLGMSSALIVAASPLGLLIPPSSSTILYAWVIRVSVLKCFLATVVPGLILIALLLATNFWLLRNNKDIKVEVRPDKFARELGKRSKQSFAALLFPAIILGGIYSGIMTPTEAAGVAVIYAIPVGFWIYRGLTWSIFVETLRDSAVTIGVVMSAGFIVLTVSRFLIFEDVPGLAESFVYSVSDNPIAILLMVNLTMILIGMLMDDISGILLASPILYPVVQTVGIDPIHFAAIVGVNMGMANITPPAAPLLYLGARVMDTPVNIMMKPLMIMIVFAWLPTLVITTFVPQVALWLPNLFFGG